MVNGYSVTSNTIKLLKHLRTLVDLQEGIVSPIMVHCIPTHKCQLSCLHCCFKNREDRTREILFEEWRNAIEQFITLGTKSFEFTGGGDPLMWSHMNKALDYFRSKHGLHVGIITNGIGIKDIESWQGVDWVRVSLNTLEFRDNLDITPLIGKTQVSLCYIWHKESRKHIEKVVDFANKHKIICRLAPDCINSKHEINRLLEEARESLREFKDNKYVFLSDFNVDTRQQKWDCRIHMIKPCLYVDGNVYSCPSAELAVENGKKINDEYMICKGKDIIQFYNREGIKPIERHCSYCKYAKQQDLLGEVLTETEFNAFA